MELDLASRVLYCDAGCVVVNKTAGEAVEGATGGMADLPRLLAAELASLQWPAPLKKEALDLPVAVHRLDVPVSGCAIFARTKPVLQFLNNTFRRNEVKKTYWAIAEIPNKDHCRLPENSAIQELVHWIQYIPEKNMSIAHNAPGQGQKKAVLHYRIAGRGINYLFLEIETLTGRHHQIRAQLARLGLHIKGDLKYGAKRSEKTGGIRLHAHSVSFPLMSGNERISLQCNPPLQDNLWIALAHLLQTEK
ncbi:MAG: RNA pseudouridine synthase [Treponema sp.]|nr:RNA pseudouridine synthase [Treponema sp.]